MMLVNLTGKLVDEQAEVTRLIFVLSVGFLLFVGVMWMCFRILRFADKVRLRKK